MRLQCVDTFLSLNGVAFAFEFTAIKWFLLFAFWFLSFGTTCISILLLKLCTKSKLTVCVQRCFVAGQSWVLIIGRKVSL